MKKLGIVGGTGPESTVDYYQSIISKYQEKAGSSEDLPELLINSINMYKIFSLLEANQTEGLADYLTESVRTLEKAGADFVVLTANTAHIVFDKVQERVNVPMISIVEETYNRTEELGLGKIGLLGTKFTMENDFFQKPFHAGAKTIVVPEPEEQQYFHEKIVSELEKGVVEEGTKKDFLELAAKMVERDGIEGLILGCTELPLIFKPEDLEIPQLNTTEIHVKKIIEVMFDEG
ncbi:aspartate/glutamate racemase family protein [Planomicrobium sp. CPCC 101110]|uniref:aspartate/glutamate racemase family protein n=1 Tax=Planomicrobium sp. CPCC 101110 TaxID=2599619 RepID=UPI0011B7265F|nr:amino acid racemase [Planomicrobium sp. CPCC 101110]TWT27174.1 amino acid racemase [Planomicrobium sp. CPCC 101110]